MKLILARVLPVVLALVVPSFAFAAEEGQDTAGQTTHASSRHTAKRAKAKSPKAAKPKAAKSKAPKASKAAKLSKKSAR